MDGVPGAGRGAVVLFAQCFMMEMYVPVMGRLFCVFRGDATIGVDTEGVEAPADVGGLLGLVGVKGGEVAEVLGAAMEEDRGSQNDRRDRHGGHEPSHGDSRRFIGKCPMMAMTGGSKLVRIRAEGFTMKTIRPPKSQAEITDFFQLTLECAALAYRDLAGRRDHHCRQCGVE